MNTSPAPKQAEAFTFGMEKVPATCELSLTVALPSPTLWMEGNVIRGYTAKPGSGPWYSAEQVQSALLAQAAEKDAEIAALKDRLDLTQRAHLIAANERDQLENDAVLWNEWLPWMRRLNKKPYNLARLIAQIDASRALAKQEEKS